MTVTTNSPVVVTSTVTKVVTKPVVDEVVNSTSVHKRIEAILKEFDNKETDIPLNHHYWNLLNQYRRLRSEENV